MKYFRFWYWLCVAGLMAACSDSGGSSSFAWPPYDDDSPWNTPIDDDVRIHPDSAEFVARLGDQLTLDTSQFTIPVYEVSSAQPFVDVRVGFLYSTVGDGGLGLDRTVDERTVSAPIPAGAFSARGSDGALVIWNPETGDEWGFFQAWQDDEGHWFATSGYYYNTRWSGVPPDGFASRGLGGPYLAGLLRPIDFDLGSINHALAFGYATPSPDFVFPAVKSDGNGMPGIDLPEGARLQLDPSLSEADLRAFGLTGAGIAIARALQEYGMILTDVSGSTKIFAEYDFSAEWPAGLLTRETLALLPMESFRVLAFDEAG